MLELDVCFVDYLCVAIKLRDPFGDVLAQPVRNIHIMSLDHEVLGHVDLL
jgi:hypothetical protein